MSPTTSFARSQYVNGFPSKRVSPNARAWATVPYGRMYLDQLVTAIGKIYNGGSGVSKTLNSAQSTISEEARNL